MTDKPVGEVLLKLEKVEAGYGPITALRGIDLEIRRGEIVTLIGSNGAGKSTTLNAICGLVQVRSGKVELFGDDITNRATTDIVTRGIAQVPEGRKLFSDMTVLENLQMGAFQRNDKAAIKQDLEHVFELFPRLLERSKQRAGSLSGGEQQMCAIGRGIMARPTIMLFDEPSLGLAPLLCDTIFETIKRLNSEGTTVLLVEQNAFAALKLAHRGYILETGAITISGPAADLLTDPRVREAYLGV